MEGIMGGMKGFCIGYRFCIKRWSFVRYVDVGYAIVGIQMTTVVLTVDAFPCRPKRSRRAPSTLQRLARQ